MRVHRVRRSSAIQASPKCDAAYHLEFEDACLGSMWPGIPQFCTFVISYHHLACLVLGTRFFFAVRSLLLLGRLKTSQADG